MYTCDERIKSDWYRDWRMRGEDGRQRAMLVVVNPGQLEIFKMPR
jgi:hypothetical protein